MSDHGRDPEGWNCEECGAYQGPDEPAYGVDEDLCEHCAAEEDGDAILATRKADADYKARAEGV